MTGHEDIRIGTILHFHNCEAVLPQLPHGFESFQLTAGFNDPPVNYREVSKRIKDSLGGKAIISSLGAFGNPLINDVAIERIEQTIDNVHLFDSNIIVGFAGSVDGKSVPDQWPRFLEVWKPLVARARDKGVKFGFECCEFGGYWHSTKWNVAHSPTAWEMIWNDLGSDVLGLCWEPCHQMVSLVDPLPQLRKYAKHVWNVHGKDATIAWDVIQDVGIRGGKPYVWHRTPGFGDTNWTDLISILRMAGWRGSIEIEGWHDPVYRGDLEYTGQVHALNYLKHCRGGPFIPNPAGSQH